jgi:VanZ family protein
MSVEVRTIPAQSWTELRFAAIAAGVAALIVYGSLFPFEFYARGGIGDAVRYLFSTSLRWWDHADALANILLYIPLGLFGARALRPLPAAARIGAVVLAGGILSFTMEITQFFDLTRAPQLSDITTNILGTAMGAVAETGLRARFFPRLAWRPFAILLLVTELGVWLFPFVPSLRPGHYVLALRAAQAPVPFEPLAVFKQVLFWLILGLLLETLAGAAVARIAPVPIAVCLLAVRFALHGESVTRADIVGAIIGVVLWVGFVWKWRARMGVVAALFVAFVALDALRPFSFSSSAREFQWKPFWAFLIGPRGSGSRTFLEKTFIYGALVWLLARSRNSWMQATLGASALLITTRVAQVWLPGRSAEITDVLMVLALAGVLKALGGE